MGISPLSLAKFCLDRDNAKNDPTLATCDNKSVSACQNSVVDRLLNLNSQDVIAFRRLIWVFRENGLTILLTSNAVLRSAKPYENLSE